MWQWIGLGGGGCELRHESLVYTDVKFVDHLNGCQFQSQMVLPVFVDVTVWSWSDWSLLIGLVQVQRMQRKVVSRRFDYFPILRRTLLCARAQHS